MFLANTSIKRPVFIVVIFISLLVIGMLSYTGLTINDMPEADIPTVTVTVKEKGASPDQLESKVTKQVEEAVGQLSGVKHISSTMMEGVSNTVVEFDLAKSPDVAAQEVRDKLGSIRGDLPKDIDDPVIAKFDMNAKAIISLAVTRTEGSAGLDRLVDDVITKELYTVKGVGDVNIYGNAEREIQIKLDKTKMAAYGLTTSEVISGLQNDNLEVQGGKVDDGDREISLKTNSNIKKVADFNDVLVTKRKGVEIRLKDVGKVVDGTEEKESLSFYEGKEAIGIDIVKQSGANTVEVATGIKGELANIQSALPEGVRMDIVRDESEAIREMVDEVMKTLFEGCILAIVIVYLFLNEWESTLISAASLPASVITSFIGLKVMNFSLNTMSLMALSLAVGLLIDDAIVVIENIVRHLHMGKTPLQAAKEATSEIGLAVLATTFAVIAVFLPIAMVSGVVGKYFIEFGITIVFSMLVSLFVSFTLVPMMSSRMLKAGKKSKKTLLSKFFQSFNQAFAKLAENYGRLLGVVLNHRLMTMILAILLFVGCIRIIPLLGFSFIPSTDQGEISITAELDSGLSLETAGKKAAEIEGVVGKYPEVQYIYTTVEKDELALLVKLADKNERQDSAQVLTRKMRDDLKAITGIELAIKPASFGPGGSTKDVSFNIKGDDYRQLQDFALAAEAAMSQDPHARDVSLNSKAGKLETKLEVDRDKAADLGVNPAAAASTISTLFNGADVGTYESGKDRYNVRVSLLDEQRKNLDSLNGIYVAGSNGNMVPLNQVTSKVFTTTSSTLHRYDRTASIEISANVDGMAVGDFMNSYLKKFSQEMQVPEGISIAAGGMNSTMQEGFSSLLLALGMGIFFLYLIMAAQFESFIDPVAILFALPLALIGAVLGLYLVGDELSIISLIGIIMLMGLVAKNAILLIDFAKQKMGEGLTIKDALQEAGLVRLRPILMTTLAMIFGMIPLATATGTGTEMRAPMAHAVIGGLISSTLLTLFVVPVAYTLLDDLKHLFAKRSKVATLSRDK